MLTDKEKQKMKDFLKTTKYPIFKEFGSSFLDLLDSDRFDELMNSEVIREVFDEVGLIPKKHNIYDAFFKEIKNIHGIEERNIIEVGGGALPRLAKRIRLSQKKGTITVYDPRLFLGLEEDSRLRLIRKPFTKSTNIGNCDLLIGLMPCKAAKDLVDQAISYDKDFIVWLCEGGWHGEPIDYFETDDEWRQSLICSAEWGLRENDSGKLGVKELKKFSPYPIIYNVREK